MHLLCLNVSQGSFSHDVTRFCRSKLYYVLLSSCKLLFCEIYLLQYSLYYLSGTDNKWH